ncbi:MAG: YjhG/YagF family D-xylonate dehydratase, partial [Planctomycetota bacterium]
MPDDITFEEIVDSRDNGIYEVVTKGPGPQGVLPLTEDAIANSPSGYIFGMSHDVGMGWEPAEAAREQFLLISTQGGIRAGDGKPVALGFHAGHYELGLLAGAAAEELERLGYMPFAAFCTDPCDGRTQGTPGMMDSLAYRNDAATIFRRLIR